MVGLIERVRWCGNNLAIVSVGSDWASWHPTKRHALKSNEHKLKKFFRPNYESDRRKLCPQLHFSQHSSWVSPESSFTHFARRTPREFKPSEPHVAI